MSDSIPGTPTSPASVQRRLALRVYFPDSSFKTIGVKFDATVEQLIEQLNEHLCITNSLGFSLFHIKEDPDNEGEAYEQVLPKSALITRLLSDALGQEVNEATYARNWRDQKALWDAHHRLLYKRQLIFLTEARVDPRTLHFEWMQAVSDWIAGRYPPTSHADIISLAAIHMRILFGPFHTYLHTPGFVTSRLHEFIPKTHFPKEKAIKAMEQEIYKEFEKLGDTAFPATTGENGGGDSTPSTPVSTLALPLSAAANNTTTSTTSSPARGNLLTTTDQFKIKYVQYLQDRYPYYGASRFAFKECVCGSRRVCKRGVVCINSKGLFILTENGTSLVREYGISEIESYLDTPESFKWMLGKTKEILEVRTKYAKDIANVLMKYTAALVELLRKVKSRHRDSNSSVGSSRSQQSHHTTSSNPNAAAN